MLIYDTNILLEAQGEYPAPPFDKVWQAAEVAFHLKELLKTVGWVHQASGDGLALFSTTPGNVNDVLTTFVAGANGLNNPLAWFVLQHPASSRRLSFQFQGVVTPYWRIKYSLSAGFTGGTPSATQTPSAVDEKFLMGSGTDAAPNFEPWLYFSSPDGVICHMAADNAAPYGFYMVGYEVNQGTSSPLFGAVFDPLVDTVAGDLDPYAFYFTNNQGNTPFREDPYSYGEAMHAWMDLGKPHAAWLSFVTPRNPPSTGVGPFNFVNNKIDRTPMYYLRSGSFAPAASGWKGRSTMMHWVGQEFRCGQTLQVVTPRDAIVVGWVMLPWNGTLPKV